MLSQDVATNFTNLSLNESHKHSRHQKVAVTERMGGLRMELLSVNLDLETGNGARPQPSSSSASLMWSITYIGI
jgi:hypothetical protein